MTIIDTTDIARVLRARTSPLERSLGELLRWTDDAQTAGLRRLFSEQFRDAQEMARDERRQEAFA